MNQSERRPVCPRCLDIEFGVPGGTPDDPHPGPFAANLCHACDVAVDLEWRRERGEQ